MFVPDASHRSPNADGVQTACLEIVRGCNAWLVSAVVHLTAMIALGIAAAVGVGESRPIKVTVHLDEGNVATEAAEIQSETAEFSSQPSGPALAAGIVRPFDEFTPATAAFATPLAPLESALFESGREGLALKNLGTDGDEGHFAKGASQFFGVNGYGNSVVYVVDCSGSMADYGKLERAKYELLHSIEQLSHDQRFFVIFYSDGAYPMFGNATVPATESQFLQTRQWIGTIDARGNTNPQPALLLALSLKPDTIYFLSDGLFDAGTIAEVRRLNRRRQGGVPIHSIAFVSRENLALMRAIARDSGGEFRFVR